MSNASEKEIFDFLNTMFGENEGTVYAPTKGTTASSFIRYYFTWPVQRAEIVQHMLQANKSGKDVWVAPALLKSNKNAKKTNWRGTQYLYVDFDSTPPSKLPEGIPAPSLKIQSSVAGREHWYWKLNEFYTGDDNREAIENINRSLAYALGADRSGWDATQVLRVPGTKHRSRGVITRVLNAELDRVYNLANFSSVLPAPSEKVELKQQEKDLPDLLQVLTRVRLSQDAQQIFNRPVEEVKDRSSALYRFAAECLEVHPPIFKADILSMLNHLAYKWGKFDGHTDRFKKVKSVLESAIEKHEPKKKDAAPDEYEAEQLRSLSELIEYTVANPSNWIVEGLLPEHQTMQIVGEANIGKSSLAVRLCADIICENDFLLWRYGNSDKQHKVAYIGLDMDEGDALDLLQGVISTLENPKRFTDNFRISTPDYGVELWDPKVQARYEEMIAASHASIVVWDSLKDTGALDDDSKRKAIFQWFKKRLRREMGLTVIVLTHTRKRDKDSKVHQTQDDVYGSGMQNADIKASLLLYRENQSTSVINVNQTKVRRAKKMPVFAIQRSDEGLKYDIVNDRVDTSEPSKQQPVQNPLGPSKFAKGIAGNDES